MNDPMQGQVFQLLIPLAFAAGSLILFLYAVSCFRRIVLSVEDLADHLERVAKRTDGNP